MTSHNIKKVVLSSAVILAFAAYAIYQRVGGESAAVYIADSQTQTGGSISVRAGATPAPAPAPASKKSTSTLRKSAPAPAPAPKPRGLYSDGTYTGPVIDAYYGNVQVQAVIQNGKLADVVFLDYPHDRGTSRYINGNATPILRSEAITAQSANVDTVSGATATSQAFNQSLASALAQAKV